MTLTIKQWFVNAVAAIVAVWIFPYVARMAAQAYDIMDCPDCKPPDGPEGEWVICAVHQAPARRSGWWDELRPWLIAGVITAGAIALVNWLA